MRARDGFRETRFVEWLKDVVHGADVESLNRVLIEGRGEDHVRHLHFAFDQFFQHAKTVEAGHFYIEENQVGQMFLYQRNRFHTVFALPDKVDLRKTLQQKGQLVARGFLVIHDDGVDVHRK